MIKFKYVILSVCYTIYILLGIIVVCSIPATLEGDRLALFHLPDFQYVKWYKSGYSMIFPSDGEKSYVLDPSETLYYIGIAGEKRGVLVSTFEEYWQGKDNYIYKIRTSNNEELWLNRMKNRSHLVEVDMSTVSKFDYFPRYRFGSCRYSSILFLFSILALPMLYALYFFMILLYGLLIVIKSQNTELSKEMHKPVRLCVGALILPWVLLPVISVVGDNCGIREVGYVNFCSLILLFVFVRGKPLYKYIF